MKKREKEILRMLINAEDMISYEQFTEKFHTSIRTIQNDLMALDLLLQREGLSLLNRKYKKGVSIDKSEESLARVLRMIGKDQKIGVAYYHYQYRLLFLSSLLIARNGYMTIAELSRELDVSKGTIMNDLNRLRQLFESDGIDLLSDTHLGICIQSEEGKLRTFLVQHFQKVLKEQAIESVEDYLPFSIAKAYLKPEELELDQFVVSTAVKFCNDIDSYFSWEAIWNFVLQTQLCMYRSRQHRYQHLPIQFARMTMSQQEFNQINGMLQAIQHRIPVEIPIDEVGNLTMQLLSGMTSKANCMENYLEIQVLVCDLIADVGKALHRDLSEDLELYHALICHIRPTLYRMINHVSLENPLLEDIEKTYENIFQTVKRYISGIEAFTCYRMSDDEIGFITLHFATVFEQHRFQEYQPIHIAIVCRFGIGTSRLLETRLSALYDVHIAGVYGLHDVKELSRNTKLDFIISTEPIQCDKVQVLQVSPLLKESDICFLDKFLVRKSKTDIELLMKIIESNCIIKNKDRLIRHLSGDWHQMIEDKKERTEVLMLKDVITKDMIKLGYQAATWEDAIREAGKLLKSGGCIEDPYIDAMVDVVNTIGDYIVIGEGIALPHSRSSDSVKKVGISFLQLAQPVYFDEEKKEPVDLIFALAAIDNQAHINALADLAKILGNSGNVEKIRGFQDVEEVFEFIQNAKEIK